MVTNKLYNKMTYKEDINKLIIYLSIERLKVPHFNTIFKNEPNTKQKGQLTAIPIFSSSTLPYHDKTWSLQKESYMFFLA